MKGKVIIMLKQKYGIYNTSFFTKKDINLMEDCMMRFEKEQKEQEERRIQREKELAMYDTIRILLYVGFSVGSIAVLIWMTLTTLGGLIG